MQSAPPSISRTLRISQNWNLYPSNNDPPFPSLPPQSLAPSFFFFFWSLKISFFSFCIYCKSSPVESIWSCIILLVRQFLNWMFNFMSNSLLISTTLFLRFFILVYLSDLLSVSCFKNIIAFLFVRASFWHAFIIYRNSTLFFSLPYNKFECDFSSFFSDAHFYTKLDFLKF